MTDSDPPAEASKQAPEEKHAESISNGRYVYCLVRATDQSEQINVTGIGDSEITIIEHRDIGAIVHHCEELYDTDDLTQLKQWLLAHQRVVDEANQSYGTPLPIRFDTIFEGGDSSVERWIESHYDRLREELSGLKNRSEYRVHLFSVPSKFEKQIKTEDAELQRLQQRQQDSAAGKRFLLEKKYDNRLRELKQGRQSELKNELLENISPLVEEIVEQESQSSLQGGTVPEDKERITRIAVLADESQETALGDQLDEFVERDGIEIRFTGPWAPYTFAPELA